MPIPIIRERVRPTDTEPGQPAIGRCDCGEEIVLHSRMTNTCNACGADYNWNGTRLAPREQWGEETGEHWTDCY